MDARTNLEKFLWNTIGPPLYYCKDCLRCVDVKVKDGQTIIKYNCEHEGGEIIAPRKAILTGTGFAGLRPANKIKVRFGQVASKITGRNV